MWGFPAGLRRQRRPGRLSPGERGFTGTFSARVCVCELLGLMGFFGLGLFALGLVFFWFRFFGFFGGGGFLELFFLEGEHLIKNWLFSAENYAPL